MAEGLLQKEVAHRLGVHPNTVRNMLGDGRLRPIVVGYSAIQAEGLVDLGPVVGRDWEQVKDRLRKNRRPGAFKASCSQAVQVLAEGDDLPFQHLAQAGSDRLKVSVIDETAVLDLLDIGLIHKPIFPALSTGKCGKK